MSIVRRLTALTRGVRARLLLAAFIALLVVAANIALLTVAGWFITAMAAAGLAAVAINYFTPAAAIRAFAIMRTLGRYLERLISHDATLRLLTRLRGRVYRSLEPLAPAGLERYRKGDLLARLVGDVDTLDNAYLEVALPVAVAVAGTCGAIAFLAMAAPVLIPVEVGLLATVGALLPWLTHRLGRRHGRAAAATTGELKAELIEKLQGLAELEVLGAAAAQRQTVARLDRRLAAAQRSAQRIDALALALTTAASGAALWLAFVILAPATAAGHENPTLLPMLVLFVLASGEIVQALPGAFRALGRTVAAAERLFEAMDSPPTVVDPPTPAPLPRSHALVFKNVSLTYPEQLHPALSDISFTVEEGTSLAIVGPSGAGKSSIAQLLLRFRDYDGGNILLGNHDLRAYAADDVRRCLGYVAQSTRLFSTTVAENLRLARPDAKDDQLWETLEAARVAEEVAALPRGLNTFVGTGGIRLSTGQARRLMLARALLKEAPILLLDEPTEGLDTVNEQALLDSFAAQRRKRTIILITHRLTGLAAMDHILVLDHGRIIQMGTHAELLAAPGLYRTMAAYFTT